MAMETFNSVENNEINESLFWFRQELKSLKKLIKSQLSARDLNNENDETDPKIIKLKNTDCQLVDRWSNLELKVVKPWDEGKYWLIIKIENWKFVFYAKHEWQYADEMFNEMKNETNIKIVDNDSINKINLYMESCGIKPIEESEDVAILEELLSNLHNVIELKNTDCQLVEKSSNLELKVVKPWNEGKYWLIIKIENWKFVFYAKHEWKYSGAMFDELRNSYDDFVMTDDDNINKVNLYLRSIGLDLINDPEDIDKLKQLFSRFDKTE